MENLVIHSVLWPDILSDVLFNPNLLSIGCIILIFGILQVIWTRKLRSEQKILQDELTQIFSELEDSKRDNEFKQCENLILSDFFHNEDHSKALNSLLKRYIPNTNNGMAGFISCKDKESTLIKSRGLNGESIQSVSLDYSLISDIRSRNLVILKEKHLRASEIYRSLSAADRKKLRTLYLFNVRVEDSSLGIFFTTDLYPIVGTIEKQLDFANQILSFFAILLKRTVEIKESQKELKYTKEILELLAITDNHDISPMEMTQDFLDCLLSRLNADRISTYVTTSNIQNPLKALVRTGDSEQNNIQLRWEEYEDELALISTEADTGLLFDTPTLRDCGVNAIIRSAMSFPMIHKSTRIGELIITRKNQSNFTDDQFELGEWASNQMASTISRIISQATMAKEARVDQLTQLSNRREFDEEIVKVLHLANQNSQECSLLFCDIDHFKKINDTYGHLTGDEVLRGTADIIKSEIKKIRSTDRAIMARYGGEEIAILLPGVASSGAFRIAETIRAKIEEKTYQYEQEQFNVTISIGTSIYPSQANNVEELIAAADSAVYQAKEQGRNRVVQTPVLELTRKS